MSARRLDLDRIRLALLDLQRRFPEINARLAHTRESMTDEVVANLLVGYAFVDELLAKDVDLFAYGQSAVWLELNTLVLCGEDPARRREFEPHRKATAEKFYAQPGGIGGIADWHARHRGQSSWEEAAGVYVRMLSEPQLFIEGNHRTGALVMSQILARRGQPPFVVTADNALAYFDPSAVIRNLQKTTFTLLFQLPKIKKRFAAYLREQADSRLLAEQHGCPRTVAIGTSGRGSRA